MWRRPPFSFPAIFAAPISAKPAFSKKCCQGLSFGDLGSLPSKGETKCKRFLPESQDQNPALTVSYVRCSLDSRPPHCGRVLRPRPSSASVGSIHISQLRCWVCGTYQSILKWERASDVDSGEPEQAHTELECGLQRLWMGFETTPEVDDTGPVNFQKRQLLGRTSTSSAW